ncbi:hypothetical protein JZU71_02490, partial [bacterium]|nr:hypothetical protein [bacterium]
MDRDQAALKLNSEIVEERLAAARFFARNADTNDTKYVVARLRVERVPWVKRALERAAERIEGKSASSSHSDDIEIGEFQF